MSGNNHMHHVVPTSTAHQARCLIYQATRRPQQIQGVEYETKWGSAKITGRLGQAHQDVHDSIMYHAERRRDLTDGRIQLLVDPYQLRITAGGGGQFSYEQLWVLLRDLLAAVIELRVPDRGIRVLGHIIDEVVESTMSRPDPRTGRQRALWRVTLGAAWSTIIEKDIGLFYDPRPVAALRYGASQALARHVLSHSVGPPGGWKLDVLLRTIHAPGRLDHRRRDVLADADGLAAIGIEVQDGRVTRTQPPGQSVAGVRTRPEGVRTRPADVRTRPEMYPPAR
jgi:hypothetical protein